MRLPALRITAILFLLCGVAQAQQQLELTLTTEQDLKDRLLLAHRSNPERYARMKSQFEDLRCPNLREQKVGGVKEPNLICESALPVEGARRILVGAHFDANGGDGVIDNWSGAVLLPLLENAMRSKPRKHHFEFVAFTGEERGLLGSSAFLKSIPKAERREFSAGVFLDSLGLSSLKCWSDGSDMELARATARIAYSMNLDFAGNNPPPGASTDSAVFKDAHIPVLSFHSLTDETLKYINSKRDAWDAVSWRDYWNSYRLISAVLVYLDETLP